MEEQSEIRVVVNKEARKIVIQRKPAPPPPSELISNRKSTKDEEPKPAEPPKVEEPPPPVEQAPSTVKQKMSALERLKSLNFSLPKASVNSFSIGTIPAPSKPPLPTTLTTNLPQKLEPKHVKQPEPQLRPADPPIGQKSQMPFAQKSQMPIGSKPQLPVGHNQKKRHREHQPQGPPSVSMKKTHKMVVNREKNVPPPSNVDSKPKSLFDLDFSNVAPPNLPIQRPSGSSFAPAPFRTGPQLPFGQPDVIGQDFAFAAASNFGFLPPRGPSPPPPPVFLPPNFPVPPISDFGGPTQFVRPQFHQQQAFPNDIWIRHPQILPKDYLERDKLENLNLTFEDLHTLSANGLKNTAEYLLELESDLSYQSARLSCQIQSVRRALMNCPEKVAVAPAETKRKIAAVQTKKVAQKPVFNNPSTFSDENFAKALFKAINDQAEVRRKAMNLDSAGSETKEASKTDEVVDVVPHAKVFFAGMASGVAERLKEPNTSEPKI